uniref:G-protein coupled receptors family 1 profile domain-containing protein n=1 Tax=Denticeps clupeoides TaxID=299321 RepID=A0AAY4E3G2_9TELE
MDNRSTYSNILHLDALVTSEASVFPVFFLLLLAYLTLLVSNAGVLILIIKERSLHQPMYLLFCNLSINDMIGNSVLLPRLLSDMVSTEKLITYGECATQVFMGHINVTIAFIFILVGLTLRLSRCRSYLMNSYCDNASLFKLSCEDLSVNNIYGLFFTVMLFCSSMGSIAVTYIRIAIVCWKKKSKDLNSKAMQTCASHLVLYLIMLCTGLLTITLHRFTEFPFLRKLAQILFQIVPGNLNPVIYGIQTKALRQKIAQIFHRKVLQE